MGWKSIFKLFPILILIVCLVKNVKNTFIIKILWQYPVGYRLMWIILFTTRTSCWMWLKNKIITQCVRSVIQVLALFSYAVVQLYCSPEIVGPSGVCALPLGFVGGTYCPILWHFSSSLSFKFWGGGTLQSAHTHWRELKLGKNVTHTFSGA